MVTKMVRVSSATITFILEENDIEQLRKDLMEFELAALESKIHDLQIIIKVGSYRFVDTNSEIFS